MNMFKIGLSKELDEKIGIAASILMLITGILLLFFNIKFDLSSFFIILGTWLIITAFPIKKSKW